jgi:hypothetical protein
MLQCLCCKCMFQIFRLFQTCVAVLSECCKSRFECRVLEREERACAGAMAASAKLAVALHRRTCRVMFVHVRVTEPTNYTRLSKKIIHRVDDLANLSPYNPVVREITTDFKPTYIPAKIVISSAVTIISYIKVRVANTSEFKHSYYKPSSNKSSGSI